MSSERPIGGYFVKNKRNFETANTFIALAVRPIRIND